VKRFISVILCAILTLVPFCVSAEEQAGVYPYDTDIASFWAIPAAAEYVPDDDAKALLLMEFSTGKVLFRKNELEHLPMASVTKVMSTLLVVEAIDSGKISLDDPVTASENAASMGGSQIFLEAGETMSVRDLLKSLVVVSANDATVALGEHLCGSEASFIAEMNLRASELGCANTHFVNTNGLPAEGHYSCALDIAVMTRELMKHPMIFEYTGIWMDTIRNGSFGLSNTNKLIRFYNGATGMKTGFTTDAGFCLSGTAARDGMQLIAVVLGCSTSDKRFAAAKSMLDYGYANYCVVEPEIEPPEPLWVRKGTVSAVPLTVERVSVLTEKTSRDGIEPRIELPEYTVAPLSKGDEVGSVVYSLGGEELARAPIRVADTVPEMTLSVLLGQILAHVFRL